MPGARKKRSNARAIPGLLLVAASLLGGGGAAAQTPPGPGALQPPGKGMLEQACPQIAVPAMPKREPGEPSKFTPEFGRAYGAAMTYQQRYDWAWQCRYQAANEILRRGPPPRVVFMGDSITEAWLQYDPALFGRGVVDRGISGQTTPQMLLRFYEDVVALRPRVVHIMAGTNDIAGNTGPTSPERFKNNIRAMVEIALANKIRVVLASITPVGLDSATVAQRPPARIVELNRWLRAYATQRGLVYADYYGALVGPDGGVRAGLTYDGLHPGTVGYAAMRPITERALARAERASR